MSTWSQVPGNLNFALVRGDDFRADIDVSINMTGYSTSASIQSAVTGQEVTQMAVSVTSATAGLMVVSIPRSQTASLPKGSYYWSMKWNDGVASRTALSGLVEVK